MLLCLESCGQQKEDFSIGKKQILHSGLLNEDRSIWIYLPRNISSALAAGRKYPVLYLLDGESHFTSVAGLVQQFSEVNGNTLCPEMIVVGIPNTNRQRDLTPTHSGVNTSGGGEIFTSFIEKELIPHIDSLYPTAPYRIFVGHSLGGLLVVNALLHHSQLFNAYLAIDPSMWWDNRTILKQADTLLTRERFKGRTLYLAVANTLPPELDTVTVRKDSNENTNHIRSILLLADRLKKANGNGLRWDYKYYSEETHSSVPLISEYDGLRFIFNFYNYKYDNKLYDSSFSAILAIASINEHYKNISAKMGYQVLPPETYINDLGQYFLQKKWYDKAYAFFKLNVDNYPRSARVFESMGDYYVVTNDKEKAINNFKTSLMLNDNSGSGPKLKKLE